MMRALRVNWAGALCAAALLGACGGDGPSGNEVGPPANLERTGGDNQEVPVLGEVPVRPAVRVTDAAGRPVPDVTVMFSIARGGGNVTGATQVTDASGIARVGGWTVGAFGGVHTLVAAAGDLAPVTFTAHAEPPAHRARCVTSAYTLGTAAEGSLSSTDCEVSDGENNFFVDLFALTIPAQRALEVRMASAVIDPVALVFDATTGNLLAYNDDEVLGVIRNSRMRVIAPPGAYVVAGTSYEPGETGSYSLSAASSSEDVTGCDAEEFWLVVGISSAQQLGTGDCTFQDGAPFDVMLLVLFANRQVNIAMSSAVVSPLLGLFSAEGDQIAIDAGTTTTPARISFIPDVSGIYILLAAADGDVTNGAYTISLQRPAVQTGAPLMARPGLGNGADVLARAALGVDAPGPWVPKPAAGLPTARRQAALSAGRHRAPSLSR